MSEEGVILLEEISSSQADTESVVNAAGTDIAISPLPPCAPEEEVVVETDEKRPGGDPKQLLSGDRGVRDEEVGTEADIENEDVDVVAGDPALANSRFESNGFSLSKIVGKKGLEEHTLSKDAVDTTRLLQCVF